MNTNIKKDFFTIPYISTISESFLLQKKFGFDIVYSIPNTLQRFIKRRKDKIDTMSKCDVVYKINCHDCNASYVGQTKRQLATKVRKVGLTINKKSGTSSVITNHRLELNHEMQ